MTSVFLIGPPKSGKTSLAKQIELIRPDLIVFDDTSPLDKPDLILLLINVVSKHWKQETIDLIEQTMPLRNGKRSPILVATHIDLRNTPTNQDQDQDQNQKPSLDRWTTFLFPAKRYELEEFATEHGLILFEINCIAFPNLSLFLNHVLPPPTSSSSSFSNASSSSKGDDGSICAFL